MSGSFERIDTNMVASLAQRVNNAREKTDSAEKTIISKINSLNNYWNSPAAQKAIESFREIQNRFDAYDSILKYYEIFISTQVVVGYDLIEMSNKSIGESLESKFK